MVLNVFKASPVKLTSKRPASCMPLRRAARPISSQSSLASKTDRPMSSNSPRIQLPRPIGHQKLIEIPESMELMRHVHAPPVGLKAEALLAMTSNSSSAAKSASTLQPLSSSTSSAKRPARAAKRSSNWAICSP